MTTNTAIDRSFSRIGSPSLAALCAALLVACATEPIDGADDVFMSAGKGDGTSPVEGSPEALGVLRVANELTLDQLDGDVGLSRQTAEHIVAHRDGADALAGTADDDGFETLAELDAVRYVGTTAFARMLAYARAHGFIAGQDAAWTVAVFMNGDNNLEPYAFDDLEEMETAGSTAAVNVVVLLDTYSRDGGGAHHLYIREGGRDRLDSLGELDLGDWPSLAEFGVWAIEHYPAQHYALMLWDHGSGWDAVGDELPLKAFSSDDHGSRDGISIAEGDFASALEAIVAAAGRKLDLVGFDACLMGMWEVGAATAPYAHYLVASSETEPGRGWDWRFLTRLTAEPTLDAEELGRAIVEHYHEASRDDSTLAVTNLDQMPVVDAAVSGLADALMDEPSCYPTIASIRAATQAFSHGSAYDLQDFAARVGAKATLPAALRAAAGELVATLESAIVYNRAQADYPNSHGLSIYFTAAGASEPRSYRSGAGARWSAETSWDEFLKSF